MGLEIDPMSAASPDLNPEQMAAMRASVERDGQLIPIVIWRGKVLDGRKRLAACEALGIEPKTITIPDEADPVAYASAINLIRTHYSPTERAMYVSRLCTLVRGRNTRHMPRTKDQLTAREGAALVGVSRAQVEKAKRIRKHGIPQLVTAAESGAITVDAADYIVRHVPKDSHADALDTHLKAKAAGRRAMPGTVSMRVKFKALPKKSPIMVVSNILDGMETTADLLSDYVGKPIANAPTEKWLTQANRVLRVLRGFRRQLNGGDHEEGTDTGSANARVGSSLAD